MRFVLMLLIVALAGCAAPTPVISVDAPDLKQTDPRTLGVADLAAGLARYMNETGEGPGGVWQRWGLEESQVVTDLDGDRYVEFVLVPSFVEGGGLIILHGRGKRWQAGWTLAEVPGREAALVAVTDLTGDRRPEIVWQTTSVGAHTGHAHVHVSQWEPGRTIALLPGTPVSISTPINVSVEGMDLVLQGGLITSAGAGTAQRPRTDRYRWHWGRFSLADRQYAPSQFAYHRIQDGMLAEQKGRIDEALRLYASAMEPDRPALAPGMVSPDGQVPPLFPQAVRAFARFRLGLLQWREGRVDDARATLAAAPQGPFKGLTEALKNAANPEAGCRTATAWATNTKSFLEALNAPYGYATIKWDPQQLCGPLPSID